MRDNERKEPNAEISIDEIGQIDEYKEWLKFAQTDFDCAEYLYKAPLHPKPLNVICYHCQQAAEKAIKALIVYFGSQGDIPKVHDLSFLLNRVKNMTDPQKRIEITHDFMVMADGLSKYGVAPRYPNEMDVDEPQTAKALRDSASIMEWAKKIIQAQTKKA